jgi:hypothetical protein
LIALITGMPFHVKLRREWFASLHLNHEMNVGRGARGISNRLDGAEVVFPARTSLEAAKPLEIHIETAGPFAASFLQVSRGAVHLPDFDYGIPDWFTVRTKEPPTEMSYLPHGRRH